MMLGFLRLIPTPILFGAFGIIAGAAALLGVYTYGKHEGKQAAAVQALEASVNVLRNKEQIHGKISSSDAAALCGSFGLSDKDTFECVRRVTEADTEP